MKKERSEYLLIMTFIYFLLKVLSNCILKLRRFKLFHRAGLVWRN